MKQKALLNLLSSGVRRRFPEPEAAQLADRARTIYFDLCREHRDDPPALKQHTEGMIFGGVALYRALQEKGLPQEEALALTDAVIQDFSRDAADKLRKLLKLPGLYRRVPGIFRSMARKKYGPEAGFRMEFYDVGKNRARFDVTVCPYYATCLALGCPELTTVFCNTDDCCYGNMHPKLKWSRQGTIGRGAQRCDFDITVTD